MGLGGSAAAAHLLHVGLVRDVARRLLEDDEMQREAVLQLPHHLELRAAPQAVNVHRNDTHVTDAHIPNGVGGQVIFNDNLAHMRKDQLGTAKEYEENRLPHAPHAASLVELEEYRRMLSDKIYMKHRLLQVAFRELDRDEAGRDVRGPQAREPLAARRLSGCCCWQLGGRQGAVRAYFRVHCFLP